MNNIQYYIFSFNRELFKGMDSRIAKQLSKKFNLNFKIIKNNVKMKKEFLNMFEEEQMILRILPKTKNIQWHYYNSRNKNIVNLNGNGGEIIKGRKIYFDSRVKIEFLRKQV